jgi:5-methylcytosine-specific restriction endonuclease McrA
MVKSTHFGGGQLRACDMCAAEFITGCNHARYCGTVCQRLSEHVARTCVVCETVWLTKRTDAKYCSELCYHFDKWGARTCAWPKVEASKREHKIKAAPFLEQRECAWCGDAFAATRRDMVNCTRACKVKASKSRRRGRQYGSTSHFTWAEFMRLFIKLDRCCAYCEQRIEGQPEPDHVVPLSRGGSNSITNILPSCSACNSDKRDLLLHDWAVDRERRGLPPRTTSVNNPSWRHLTDALLAA